MVVAAIAAQGGPAAPRSAQEHNITLPSPQLLQCEPLLLLNMSRFCEGVPGGEGAAPAVLAQVQALLMGSEAQEKAQQLLQHGYAVHSHSGRAASDVACLQASTGEAWATVHLAPRLVWRRAVGEAAASTPLSASYDPQVASTAAQQTATGADQAAGRADSDSDGSRGGDSDAAEEGLPAHVQTAAAAWAVLTAPHAEPWAVVDAVRWAAERGGGDLLARAAATHRVTALAEAEAEALNQRVQAHGADIAAAWHAAVAAAEGVLAHASVAARLGGARKQLAHIRATAGAAGSAVSQGPLASVLGDVAADEAGLQAQAERAACALLAAKVAFVKAASALGGALHQHCVPLWAMELIVAGQWEADGGSVEPEELWDAAGALPQAAPLAHEEEAGVPSGGVFTRVMLRPPAGWPAAYRDAAAVCNAPLRKQAQRLEAAQQDASAAEELASPLALALHALLRGSWRLVAADTPRQAALRQAVVLGRILWMWRIQFGRVPALPQASSVADLDAPATAPTATVAAAAAPAPRAKPTLQATAQTTVSARPPTETHQMHAEALAPAVVLRGRTSKVPVQRKQVSAAQPPRDSPGDAAAAAMLAGAGLPLGGSQHAVKPPFPDTGGAAAAQEAWAGGSMAARGSLFALAELHRDT